MKKPIKKQSIPTIYTIQKPYSKTNFVLILDDIFSSKRRLFYNWNERSIFKTYPIIAKLIFSLSYDNKFVVYIDSTGKVITTLILEKGINTRDVKLGETRIFDYGDIRSFAIKNDYVISNLTELKSAEIVEDIPYSESNFDNIPINFESLDKNVSNINTEPKKPINTSSLYKYLV